MKKIAGLTILLAIFLVGAVLAGDPGEIRSDKKELKQDAKEINQSKQCLDDLTALMKKWSDATVAGDKRKSRQFEQAIYNLLVRDISASSWAVWQAEHEVIDSKKEAVSDHPGRDYRVDDRADYRDDRRDCTRSRKILEAKEHLVERLNDKQSFTYKHQLLSDYRELLRREIGLAKSEWAEDMRELREDKK